MPDFSSSKQRSAYRLAYQRQRRITLSLVVSCFLLCAVGVAFAWLVASYVGGVSGVGIWFSLSITIILLGLKLFHDFAKWIALLPATVDEISWASILRGWWKGHLFIVAPLVTAIWLSTLHPYAGIILVLLGYSAYPLVRRVYQRRQRRPDTSG